MALDQTRFLLDENIPKKLLETFKIRRIDARTVQQAGWAGIKNGDLAKKVASGNFVLVTRDKDFTFTWKKNKIKVVYLAIEPATLRYIKPKMEELVDNWGYDTSKPFLIMVQNNVTRYWQGE